MPHVMLAGHTDIASVGEELPRAVRRWHTAVLKIEGTWLRSDGMALLVEAVVVEHSRPLHPVVMVAHSHGDTVVRLWPRAPAERTLAVQRLLVEVAAELQKRGAGPLRKTNIAVPLWQDLGLRVGDDVDLSG